MRKMHRLHPKHKDCTLCGQKGQLSVVPETNELILQGIPFCVEHRVTTDDLKVTCILCVRKIIGVPRMGRRKRIFRSRHIVKANKRLGLLK